MSPRSRRSCAGCRARRQRPIARSRGDLLGHQQAGPAAADDGDINRFEIGHGGSLASRSCPYCHVWRALSRSTCCASAALLCGVAPVRARALSSIQVCGGIGLRIVWISKGTVLLAPRGADSGRESASGRSGPCSGVPIYISAVLFKRGYVLGILVRPATLGHEKWRQENWKQQQSSGISHTWLLALGQPIPSVRPERGSRLVYRGRIWWLSAT